MKLSRARTREGVTRTTTIGQYASRYRQNHDSSGNILNLLNSKLEPQSDLIDAHLEQVWPLNFTVPNEKLITPATVALFTAKAVGLPLLQKAFETYFKRFRDIIPRAQLNLFYAAKRSEVIRCRQCSQQLFNDPRARFPHRL